jgi:predicted Zn-dependent protease with MMP-like domain
MRYKSNDERYSEEDLDKLIAEISPKTDDVIYTILSFCNRDTVMNMYWMAKCNLVECYFGRDLEHRYAKTYAYARVYLKSRGWFEGVDEELDARGSYLC